MEEQDRVSLGWVMKDWLARTTESQSAPAMEIRLCYEHSSYSSESVDRWPTGRGMKSSLWNQAQTG